MSYGLQKHIYEPKACFLIIKNSAGAMQHHNGKTRQNIENIDIIKPFWAVCSIGRQFTAPHFINSF